MTHAVRTGLRSRLAALVVAGAVALVGVGSAFAADDTPSRAGYCMGTKFLDLVYGQPLVDPEYEGAVLAWYVAGKGLTCDAPPEGYIAFTTAADELGVPGGLYAYWVPD
jgi:hypothetical protein